MSVSSNVGENPFFKRASQPKVAKKSLKTRYFSISRSFKVIDVGALGKLASSKSVSI